MHSVTTTGTHYRTTTHSNCVFSLLYNVVYLPSISWMSSPILSITAPWRQRSEHMYMSSDIMKAKHTHTHTTAHRSLPCTHTVSHTHTHNYLHPSIKIGWYRSFLVFPRPRQSYLEDIARVSCLEAGICPSLLPWSWYLCLPLSIIIYRMETVKAQSTKLWGQDPSLELKP